MRNILVLTWSQVLTALVSSAVRVSATLARWNFSRAYNMLTFPGGTFDRCFVQYFRAYIYSLQILDTT